MKTDKKLTIATSNEIYIVKQNVLRFFQSRGWWVRKNTLLEINKAVEDLLFKAIERTKKNRYVKKSIKPEAI